MVDHQMRRASDRCKECGDDWHDSPCEELKSHKNEILEKLDQLIHDRSNVEEEILMKINSMTSEIHSAFVDGDLSGHRNAHQTMIDANKAAEKFWDELRLDLAKKSLWGLLLLLLGFAMLGLATKFGIGGVK